MGGNGQEIIEIPPWIGAMIDRLPVATTESAADGTFRLEGVAPTTGIVGGVDKRGLVGATFGPVDLSSGTHDLGAIELKKGRTIRGTVEDSSGEPAVGVDV